MTIHREAELTALVIEALEDAGLLVGDAERPPGGGWQGTPDIDRFVPYADVWPVAGGIADGSIKEPYADVNPDYIIRTFGRTRRQAQELHDAVWEVLLSLDGAEYGNGRRIQIVRPDVLPGVFRDDDAQPPVFFCPSRWRFMTTGPANV